MAVITVSRGSYTGGKTLAECVAKRLAYRCIDRDDVIKSATEWGLPDGELHKALEKRPRLLDLGQHSRYTYLAVIQAALTEEAKKGNVVYHGLAGHLLLKPGAYLLRVRVIAPMEYRIRMVRERMHLNRADSIKHIEQMDQERRRWTRMLYNVNWDDASLYDVVLNLEYMDIEEACRMVCAMSVERSQHFTVQVQNQLTDAAIASRAKAQLAVNELTSSLELALTCDDGNITCSGEIAAPYQAKDIRRIVMAVPGVREVELEGLKLIAHI